ncbi:MAG: hypothetical protein AB6733_00195 [Clostridiaceae bacterium]
MNEYQRRVIEGRKQFLQLQAAQEKELLKIYKEAAKQITVELTKAKNGSLNQRYLKSLSTAMNSFIKTLNANLSKSITGGIQASSQLSAQVQLYFFTGMNLPQSINAGFDKMFVTLNTDVMKTLINGSYYADGKSLNQRIWNLTSKNAKDIDRIIKINVAKGVNAGDLAKALSSYIDPTNPMITRTRVPGINKSIAYQAQRLARTSLTHASNETFIQGAKKNPFCTGLKWNLSNSHYERQVKRWGPDICDDYAGRVFKADDYPFAHPNCLCYPTQAVMDPAEARKDLIAWVNGSENSNLDKWIEDYGPDIGIKGSLDKKKDKIFSSFSTTPAKSSSIIKDKNLSKLVDDLKQLDVAAYTKRRDLGQDILNSLNIGHINVSVKSIAEHGYCRFDFSGGISDVLEYTLNSKDIRGNTYQVKTAFHEAFHAKSNGMRSDYPSVKTKWLEVEETFAESSSHFMVKTLGIDEEISPSYAEKLVNMLPRLKQIDKYKDCSSISDFGEIAWADRLNDVHPEWEGLYDECMKVSIDFNTYAAQYIPYIESNKEVLVDLTLANMPQYEQYRTSFLRDCTDAINKIRNNDNLNSNQNMVFKNVLANAMNRLGVR